MAPCDPNSANRQKSKPASIAQKRSPYKSHENEDVPGISHHFYAKRLLNPEPFDAQYGPFMHKGLHASKMAGKRKLEVDKARPHLYSVEGRMGSYSSDADHTEWVGPAAKLMAEAGLSRKDKSNFKAECLFCGVTLRVKDAQNDPRVLHKDMSPNCKYIRMLRENGTNSQPDGAGTRRRNSYSSFHALTRESEE